MNAGTATNFGNFVLHASQLTGMYLRPEILFSGTIVAPRSIKSVAGLNMCAIATLSGCQRIDNRIWVVLDDVQQYQRWPMRRTVATLPMA